MASPLWSFPNPVNEKAARTVAAGVAVLTAVVLATRWWWLTPVLALGFLARVLTGPSLSPLGQLATRVVAPRLGPPKEVPGPPKRFAQAIGLAVTTAATVAWFGFGAGGGDGRAPRPAARVRAARVGRRVLRRMLAVQGADAGRRDPGVDVRGVRRHLGPRPLSYAPAVSIAATVASSTGASSSRRASVSRALGPWMATAAQVRPVRSRDRCGHRAHTAVAFAVVQRPPASSGAVEVGEQRLA